MMAKRKEEGEDLKSTTSGTPGKGDAQVSKKKLFPLASYPTKERGRGGD